MVDIVIGDEHGRKKFSTIYNEIKDRTDIRYIISTGDYYDPYFFPEDNELLDNFNNIIKIAREDSRVKLLFGNHDIHYLVNCDKSRYDYHNAKSIRKALNDNYDLFSLVIQLDKETLVSHAGVTKRWLEEHGLKLEDVNNILKDESLILEHLTYNNRDYSGYGEAPYQSVVWVRPNGLLSGGYPDGIKTQIVGHTTTQNIGYFGYFTKGSPDKPQEIYNSNKETAILVDTSDAFTYYEREINE